MPITVVDLGTVSSTGGSSTIVMTGINVPPGAFIYNWSLERTIQPGQFGGGSVIDSGGNTYFNVDAENPGNVSANGVCRSEYAFTGRPIFNGSITRSKSTTSTPIAMGAFYAMGVRVDANVGNDPIDSNTFSIFANTSSTPNNLSGSGFRFQFPGEFVAANTFWIADTGDAYTQSGGPPWAAPPTTFISTALGIGMAGGWVTNQSIQAIPYTPLLSNSRPWTTFIQAWLTGGDVGHDSTTLYGIGNY